MSKVKVKVENKEQLFDLLFVNTEAIKHYGVSKLGVLGSFVRNEMKEESDVDFLVDFSPGKKIFKNLMAFADFLEELCGRKIELVTVKSLSKYIGPKILATAEYVIFQH